MELLSIVCCIIDIAVLTIYNLLGGITFKCDYCAKFLAGRKLVQSGQLPGLILNYKQVPVFWIEWVCKEGFLRWINRQAHDTSLITKSARALIWASALIAKN